MHALVLIGLVVLCTAAATIRPKMRTLNGSIYLDIPAGQDVNIVQWNADGTQNSTVALSQLLQQATVETQNQIAALRTDLQGQGMFSRSCFILFLQQCAHSLLYHQSRA